MPSSVRHALIAAITSLLRPTFGREQHTSLYKQKQLNVNQIIIDLQKLIMWNVSNVVSTFISY